MMAEKRRNGASLDERILAGIFRLSRAFAVAHPQPIQGIPESLPTPEAPAQWAGADLKIDPCLS
jgi:hypothetical protein